MRRFVARLLGRLADQIHPQQELRIRVTADATGFNEACRDAAAKLRRLNAATRPEPPPPQPNMDIVTGPEKRSPS